MYLHVFFSILKSLIQNLTHNSGSRKVNWQNITDLQWSAIKPAQCLELNFPYKPVKPQRGTVVMDLVLGRLWSQTALRYHLVATAWSGIKHNFNRELKELSILLKNRRTSVSLMNIKNA